MIAYFFRKMHRLTFWTRKSEEVRVPIYEYKNEKKDDLESLLEERLSKRGSVASSVAEQGNNLKHVIATNILRHSQVNVELWA